MKTIGAAAMWMIASLLALAAGGCNRSVSPPAALAASSATIPAVVQAPSLRPEAVPVRDLSFDESMGGHTLARHVGKTDAELRDRLRRERQISSASTYTDRATAERAVAAALASAGAKLTAWQSRKGSRPNLVLRYVDRAGRSVGRSLFRGQQKALPCDRVLVVLRWDERSSRFYVLTSYPEAAP